MTSAEAGFNNSLRPRKPEGSLRRTAQDGHLDSHTAPELTYGRWKRFGAYKGSLIPHAETADSLSKNQSGVGVFASCEEFCV